MQDARAHVAGLFAAASCFWLEADVTTLSASIPTTLVVEAVRGRRVRCFIGYAELPSGTGQATKECLVRSPQADLSLETPYKLYLPPGLPAARRCACWWTRARSTSGRCWPSRPCCGAASGSRSTQPAATPARRPTCWVRTARCTRPTASLRPPWAR